MYLDRNARLQEEANMVEKWSWLTEGIENKDDVINTSIVLQNSYESMIQEGQLQEGWLEALLNEEEINEAPNLSTNVGTNVIPKVLFPVIRRVMPSLIANQLVSVQPIAARTGVIYNISYNFTDTKGGITAGDEYSGSAQSPGGSEPGFATWYSSEKIGPFTATIPADSDDVDTTVDCGVSISSFLGTDVTGFTVKRIDVYNADTGAKFVTVLDQADVVEGTPGFAGVGNVGYNVTTGDVILKSTTTATSTPNPEVPWVATDEVITYLTYDQEASDKIPEMEFSIQSQTVDTTERKLKIRWTKEAEQDMKAYHKIDVESELVKVASMEMNYEIDRELLKSIGDVVVPALDYVHVWDDDAIGTGGAGGNNTSGNYLDRHRALSQKISMLAAKVAQYNRQGGANWAVVSPQVAATLQMLPNFKGEIAGNQMNISQAGVLNGTIKVYVDPNKSGADSNEILMGFKSTSSTYGAGIVYSPYTNWMSNTVTHPDNFNSIRGFFSRYAVTKVVRGEFFYSKLSITGLELA